MRAAGDASHLGEDEEVVVALDLAGMVLEMAGAEVLLRELVRLDRRAHRAVHDHDALRHRLRQVIFDRVGVLRAVGLFEGQRREFALAF